MTLALSDDGTGTLNYLGTDPHSVTWTASSNTEGELSVDGGTNALALEEGVMTMTDEEGTFMTFVKVSDEPTAATVAASAASDQASSASAESASSQDSDDAEEEVAEETEYAEDAGEDTEAAAADEWSEDTSDEGDQSDGEESSEEVA